MDNERLLINECSFRFFIEYDSMCNAAYGRYKGFDLVVHILDRSSFARYLNVSFSASYKGGTLNSFEVSDVELPAGTRVSVDGYTVNIALLISTEDVVEKIAVATDTIIERVKSLGGERCDVYGTPGEANFRQINGKFCFVSEFSSGKVAASSKYSSGSTSYNQNYSASYEVVKEKHFRGIIGALIGGTLGGLIIYMISTYKLFNKISFLAFLSLALLTIAGYRIFAKKFSKTGIFICVLIAMFSTYFSIKLFVTYEICESIKALGYNLDFSGCFKNLRKLYDELGLSDSYDKAIIGNTLDALWYTCAMGLVYLNAMKYKK